ncbi:MAG: hypothetical protein CMP23_15310 [Rickettsiales bacterium]|nr:hypothetical protein [Rickettsiales bacterium]
MLCLSLALSLTLSCYQPGTPGGSGAGGGTWPGADDDDSSPVDDDDTSPAPDDDDSALPMDDDDDDSALLGDDDDSAAESITLAPPSACPCGFGQICVAGFCQFVTTFAVGLLEAANSGDAEIPSAMACFWNPAYIGSVVVNEDNCQVRVLPTQEPPEALLEQHGGTVTVSGGQTDPLAFTHSGPSGCMASNTTAGVTDLFEQGDVLEFVGSGGVNLPAFSVTLVAPGPIQGSPGSVTPGNPVTVAWNGSGADFVEVTLATEDSDSGYAYAASCRFSDSGAASFPAEITAFLPEQHQGFEVAIARSEVEHLEYPDLGLVIEVVAQTSWTSEVGGEGL